MLMDAIGVIIISVGCFAAGLFGGITLMAMAQAGSRDARERELREGESGNVNKYND